MNKLITLPKGCLLHRARGLVVGKAIARSLATTAYRLDKFHSTPQEGEYSSFSTRHIGPREAEKTKMLNKIGFNVSYRESS